VHGAKRCRAFARQPRKGPAPYLTPPASLTPSQSVASRGGGLAALLGAAAAALLAALLCGAALLRRHLLRLNAQRQLQVRPLLQPQHRRLRPRRHRRPLSTCSSGHSRDDKIDTNATFIWRKPLLQASIKGFSKCYGVGREREREGERGRIGRTRERMC
jgi:hypothetical protein